MNWEILSYVAAFVTAILGWYLAESTRNKNSADTAKSLTEAAMTLVDQKDEEIAELKKERTYRKLYVVYLLNGIDILLARLEDRTAFAPMTLEEFTEKMNKN